MRSAAADKLGNTSLTAGVSQQFPTELNTINFKIYFFEKICCGGSIKKMKLLLIFEVNSV